jgi:hypothetical protein
MPDATQPASNAVLADLRATFGPRLHSYVVYAPGRAPRPSLAIVESLSFADLSACAQSVRKWHRAGLATPVILVKGEFGRSLDAFPIEFGEIIAAYETLYGEDPFAGLTVDPGDLRRACETQVRSLLLHLREDFMESEAQAATLRALVAESAPGFRALLRQLARLDQRRTTDDELPAWAATRLGIDRGTVTELLQLALTPDRHKVDVARLFPSYLAATEQLARRIDEWA